MYQTTELPDAVAVLTNGSSFEPIITLADEHGGRAQIAKDDGCYVLALKGNDGRYKWVTHWFPEATFAFYEFLMTRLDRLERFAHLILP